MKTNYHHCPACHQDVDFILDHSCKRCPICYAEFPRDQALPGAPAGTGSTKWSGAQLTKVVLLVLLGVPALFLAIAFIGCALGGSGVGH